MNMTQLKWIGICFGAFILLLVVPVSIKYISDNKPKWDKAAKLKKDKQDKMDALLRQSERNEAINEGKRRTAETEETQRRQENVDEFIRQYKRINDICVTEPTRPLADLEEEVLKMHYLWLEVRKYPYFQYKAEERMKIDAMVAKCVAEVEKDKKVREIFSK
jgi:hypothetical protein